MKGAYNNPENIIIDSLRDLAVNTMEDGWKVALGAEAFPLVPVKFAY